MPARDQFDRVVSSRWLLPGLAVLLALHAWHQKSGIDLQVYLRAGARALTGEELYLVAESSPFKYAPPTALLFAPLSLVPYALAHGVWLIASALAFSSFVSAEASARGLGRAQALLVLVLCAPYLAQVLYLGQADALLVWVMAVFERRAQRTPLRAGLLWALVCAFKLPYLLFLLPALAFREWRRLQGLAAGGLLVILCGALRFGPGGLLHELEAWRALLLASTPSALVALDNQSLSAIICSLGLASSPLLGPANLAGGGLLIATAAYATARARPAGRARLLASAFTFFLAAFLSPLGWLSNLVVAAPLAAELLASRRLAARLGLAAMAALLLFNFDLLGRAGFERALGYKVFGWGLLLAALSLLVTAVTPAPARRAALPLQGR